jgi:hypothetical protein
MVLRRLLKTIQSEENSSQVPKSSDIRTIQNGTKKQEITLEGLPQAPLRVPPGAQMWVKTVFACFPS